VFFNSVKNITCVKCNQRPQLLLRQVSVYVHATLLMLIHFITQCLIIRMILWETVANAASTALHILFLKDRQPPNKLSNCDLFKDSCPFS